MGGESSTHRTIRFWCESQQETEHYEELNVGWRIILQWILEK
jgi:hypothetical protein